MEAGTRRWLKIGSGVAGSIITILAFFQLLITLYGFQITDLSGDVFCSGTFENPCISDFDIRNPNPYYVDIYNKDQVKLDFSPEIEDYALFVQDKRCSAYGSCRCELKDGRKIGFEDWRCVDFTNKTKPRKDKKYNFRFPAYTTKHFRLAGIKKNSSDTVKWGIGLERGYLDPIWYPESYSYSPKFSYVSKRTLKLIKYQGLEKWLLENKSWYFDDENLHIDLTGNVTVWNFISNACDNPTMAKCQKAEPYIQEDYPNFTCSNSAHRDLLLTKICNFKNKGIKLIHRGINKGYVNRSGKYINITIPISELKRFDFIELGESSVVYQYDEFTATNSVLTNVTVENNFSHLDVSDTAPYDSLIFYMPFDDNQSDTTAYDYTEVSVSDGTYNGGANYSDKGPYGGSVNLDGNGDYIRLGSNIDNLRNFTYMAWVYIDKSCSDNSAPIVGKYNLWNPYSVLNVAGGSKLEIFVEGSTDFQLRTNYNVFDGGKWEHVVGVVEDMNASESHIYVDAVESTVGYDVQTSGVAPADDSSYDYLIGARDNEDKELCGWVDEVMIFNTTLTSSQIQDIYNNQSARFKSPGTQMFNFTNSTAHNYINVTTDKHYEDLNSNISIFVDYYDGSWQTTSEKDFTDGENVTFSTPSATKWNVSYKFYAGNQTYYFYSPILFSGMDFEIYDAGAVDNEYPVFSNYWDNNASVVDSGDGHFNVTVTSTNGTVYLEIDGNNVTAENLTSDVYNATYTFSSGGVYTYRWHSWGNGTDENYNKSTDQSYTVNTTTKIGLDVLYPTTNISVNKNSFFNVTLNVSCLSGSCGVINVSLDPTTYYYQEFANVSDNNSQQSSKDEDPPTDTNSDLMNYSGEYYIYNGTESLSDISEVLDGNWSDDNYIYLSFGDWTDFVINYTKPSDAIGAKWEVKDNSAGSGTRHNYSIPSDCFSQNPLQLRVCAGNDGMCNNLNIHYCYNGSGWENFTMSWTSTYGFTEEAIYWQLNTTKSGLIPTESEYTDGTDAFYTNKSNNPFSTSSLSSGQSETIVFWVNATGDTGEYDFFAFANATSNLSIGNITNKWNVTITTAGNADVDYSSNIGLLRFLNCSPGWEYYPTEPDGQTSGKSAVNATNNGSATGDFQIKLTGSAQTNWTLFACNDSSGDPVSDIDCLTLSTSWQTIWSSITQNSEKEVWLYGNCSYVSADPKTSFDMQAT